MPKINRLECLKEIKNMKHLNGVPVIIYTTFLLVTDLKKQKI